MTEVQIEKQTASACVTRVEPEPVACAPTSMRLIDLARRVAASDCTVLIVGESGTGKEVLARYIHRHSTRGTPAFRRGQLRRDPREHARGHAVRL